ncbi:hypothetical protein WOLCODRAFT_19173 [Wolfiporia cocos MD-104 SS10]|uniref:Uncharacterized protein n=1 Tax=Wolfiporia cocos (strain MD-104) TaxID=742152 RepID=A0A2H3JTE0_WOLCO|nr:hypothetical protein WOLCODRAFT_19173 [Wolfiporia cocos MD-104 SS10]
MELSCIAAAALFLLDGEACPTILYFEPRAMTARKHTTHQHLPRRKLHPSQLRRITHPATSRLRRECGDSLDLGLLFSVKTWRAPTLTMRLRSLSEPHPPASQHPGRGREAWRAESGRLPSCAGVREGSTRLGDAADVLLEDAACPPGLLMSYGPNVPASFRHGYVASSMYQASLFTSLSHYESSLVTRLNTFLVTARVSWCRAARTCGLGTNYNIAFAETTMSADGREGARWNVAPPVDRRNISLLAQERLAKLVTAEIAAVYPYKQSRTAPSHPILARRQHVEGRNSDGARIPADPSYIPDAIT